MEIMGYVCCGKCEGNVEYVLDIEEPEVCTCKPDDNVDLNGMLPGNLRNSLEYEEEQNALAGGNTNTGRNLRNSQEYESNLQYQNLSLPGNLRNSQEYEEEQNALAGGHTNTGRNLRNSQEYEGLPPAMEGGNTNMGKTLRNSQEYEEVDKEYGCTVKISQVQISHVENGKS